MYKAVLFDLDGTLLDTTPGVIHAVIYTIKELGLQMLSQEILQNFVGPPMQLSFQKYFSMDKTNAMQSANLFRKNYKEQSLLRAELYPQTIEIIRTIKNKGYKIAVATNKSHDNAVMLLKYFGIADFCDYMLGSDLEGKLKKSDIIDICMKHLDVKKEDTVYVGDSFFDLEGAKATEIDFIAATYGFGFDSRTKFNNTRVVGTIGTIGDVLAFL